MNSLQQEVIAVRHELCDNQQKLINIYDKLHTLRIENEMLKLGVTRSAATTIVYNESDRQSKLAQMAAYYGSIK